MFVVGLDIVCLLWYEGFIGENEIYITDSGKLRCMLGLENIFFV
jgi:hypothetical protein